MFLLNFDAFILKKKLNPIDSITFNGCMGFKIGDGYDFVVSRIKHLNLLSAQQKETFVFLKERVEYMPIEACSNMFNNVKLLQFIFDNRGSLEKIYIHINPDQYDLESMYGVLIVRLERMFGVEHIETSKYSEWKTDNKKVYLELSTNRLIVCVSKY